MADELQALLDKIADGELKKADGERERILSQAREEAAAIVAEARKQAASMVESARKESEMLVQKGGEALKQASRDVLLSLRSTLERRVSEAAEKMVREGLTGANLSTVIVTLIEGFLKTGSDDIRVLLNPADLSLVEGALKGALVQELRSRCELSPDGQLNGGFKLCFKEEGVVYDFSDKALAETLSAGLGSKLASIIKD